MAVDDDACHEGTTQQPNKIALSLLLPTTTVCLMTCVVIGMQQIKFATEHQQDATTIMTTLTIVTTTTQTTMQTIETTNADA